MAAQILKTLYLQVLLERLVRRHCPQPGDVVEDKVTGHLGDDGVLLAHDEQLLGVEP